MLRGGTEESPTMHLVSGPIQTLQDCPNPNQDRGFAREMSIALEFQEPYFYFFQARTKTKGSFIFKHDGFNYQCVRKVQRFTFFSFLTFYYVTVLFQN